MTTETLRALRRRPMAAVVMPLPTELTTPPVMKMYLAVMYPQSEGASSSFDSLRTGPPMMIAERAEAGKSWRTLDWGLGTQDLGRQRARYDVRGASCEALRRTPAGRAAQGEWTDEVRRTSRREKGACGPFGNKVAKAPIIYI